MVPARDVALKVLSRIEQDGAFAAAALAAELTHVTDSREAAFATELVLGVLRRRSLLDDLLEKKSSRGLARINPRVRSILRIGAYQILFLDRVPRSAAVSEAVNQTRKFGSKGLTGLVNALLRKLSETASVDPAQFDRDDGGPIEDASVRLGIPPWLMARFVDRSGRDGAFATARAFNMSSRRTLRVNTHRIRRDEVLQQLKPSATPGRFTPWSIDIRDAKAAANLFEQGHAVYQDEGAQLVAMAVEPMPGHRILDACAGRGGKTAALSMMTNGQATIVATDRKPNKLERLAFELDRQGLKASTIAADITGETEILGADYDRILLDAPCSGTGTLGRRPEIRWRIQPETISSLSNVQRVMLENAAPLLAPGGRLVYAVCSLMPEEGVVQGERFLDSHPDFHYTMHAPSDWPDVVSWNGGAAMLDPGIHGTDGYQILSFTKN